MSSLPGAKYITYFDHGDDYTSRDSFVAVFPIMERDDLDRLAAAISRVHGVGLGPVEGPSPLSGFNLGSQKTYAIRIYTLDGRPFKSGRYQELHRILRPELPISMTQITITLKRCGCSRHRHVEQSAAYVPGFLPVDLSAYSLQLHRVLLGIVNKGWPVNDATFREKVKEVLRDLHTFAKQIDIVRGFLPCPDK